MTGQPPCRIEKGHGIKMTRKSNLNYIHDDDFVLANDEEGIEPEFETPEELEVKKEDSSRTEDTV
ncbi:hypothetical protein ABTE71_20965, partial [Acinetobacter baumannii]